MFHHYVHYLSITVELHEADENAQTLFNANTYPLDACTLVFYSPLPPLLIIHLDLQTKEIILYRHQYLRTKFQSSKVCRNGPLSEPAEPALSRACCAGPDLNIPTGKFQVAGRI